MNERAGRSYGQYCGVARALDLVGDRWALLVVRELLLGPRRFSDLASGLPGVSTNVLAGRLRRLEAGGVIERRTLPRPAPATVYDLTDYGRDLEPVVLGLGRWGARTLGPREPGQALCSHWLALALKGFFRAEEARDLTAAYEVRLADGAFRVAVEDGRVDVRWQDGRADADLALEAGDDALVALLAGAPPGRLLAAGDVRLLVGDRAGLDRFVRLFRFEEDGAQPPAAAAAR